MVEDDALLTALFAILCALPCRTLTFFFTSRRLHTVHAQAARSMASSLRPTSARRTQR